MGGLFSIESKLLVEVIRFGVCVRFLLGLISEIMYYLISVFDVNWFGRKFDFLGWCV